MKKSLIIAMVLIAGTLFAQESNVPANVKAKFKALYPHAENVKWDVEKPNYEVNFEADDTETSLLFNAKGNVVEVETALEEDDMPEVIEKSVEKNFPGWELKEGAKIVRGGKTTYEAELEKGEKKMDAIFSPDGKLVKKITKVEKDEENGKAEKGEKGEKKEQDEENEK
jgi:creatinine amidohydrolase/Fe(II)-dependent formamide hydrolase-like protein